MGFQVSLRPRFSVVGVRGMGPGRRGGIFPLHYVRDSGRNVQSLWVPELQRCPNRDDRMTANIVSILEDEWDKQPWKVPKPRSEDKISIQSQRPNTRSPPQPALHPTSKR